jgi:hypothetical protein
MLSPTPLALWVKSQEDVQMPNRSQSRESDVREGVLAVFKLQQPTSYKAIRMSPGVIILMNPGPLWPLHLWGFLFGGVANEPPPFSPLAPDEPAKR